MGNAYSDAASFGVFIASIAFFLYLLLGIFLILAGIYLIITNQTINGQPGRPTGFVLLFIGVFAILIGYLTYYIVTRYQFAAAIYGVETAIDVLRR